MKNLTQNRPLRVVLAKIGLDGHDRGIKVVAQALKDAGMEVIYLGMRIKPEDLSRTALQEDADVIGISSLSGAHMRLLPKVIQSLKENQLFGDMLLMVGGTIPEKDVQPLKDMGVDGVFHVGTFTDTIVEFIRNNARVR